MPSMQQRYYDILRDPERVLGVKLKDLSTDLRKTLTPSEIQEAKREVARIKTIRREKQLERERTAAAQQAAPAAGGV